MIIDNSINSIRSRFIIICGMILLWLYFTSLFLPSKKLSMNPSESPDIINNFLNEVEEKVTIVTKDEPINTDSSTQASSSSTTTTKVTLPAVVFISKPTTSRTAIPSSSDTPSPSSSTSMPNETNDNTTSSSSTSPHIINDAGNEISKTKSAWDDEKNDISESEFLESEEDGSGSGGYEITTPEYLEDILNYKRNYPRFKQPINEEYLSKIAHD